MKRIWTTTLALVGSLLAPASMAQTTATPTRPVPPSTNSGVNASTSTTPRTGVVDPNTGPAAASGDRNQAVATTTANAPQPAKGANSFNE